MRMRHRLGTCWLGRLLRGRWLDRNPLRRGSDRAETAVLGVLLAAFLAGAPLAAHVAGHWAAAASAREAQVQRTVLHHVPATLLQPASDLTVFGGQAVWSADARWTAPDGHARTGQLVTLSQAAAGRTVMIWVNQAGQPSDPPLQHGQAVGRTQLAEGFAVASSAVALIVVGGLARRSLDRRRMAAWDADWMATGPRWSPRR
jgi:Na+-transporting NADH:ubiquinone oxidoreductase subunit NqrB